MVKPNAGTRRAAFAVQRASTKYGSAVLNGASRQPPGNGFLPRGRLSTGPLFQVIPGKTRHLAAAGIATGLRHAARHRSRPASRETGLTSLAVPTARSFPLRS